MVFIVVDVNGFSIHERLKGIVSIGQRRKNILPISIADVRWGINGDCAHNSSLNCMVMETINQ
jgi:hypothetical protein